jgi:hypothetical protein
VLVSRDLELGFGNFAPEPLPEGDHPGKRDGVWVGIWCDVQFVALDIFV